MCVLFELVVHVVFDSSFVIYLYAAALLFFVMSFLLFFTWTCCLLIGPPQCDCQSNTCPYFFVFFIYMCAEVRKHPHRYKPRSPHLCDRQINDGVLWTTCTLFRSAHESRNKEWWLSIEYTNHQAIDHFLLRRNIKDGGLVVRRGRGLGWYPGCGCHGNQEGG